MKMLILIILLAIVGFLIYSLIKLSQIEIPTDPIYTIKNTETPSVAPVKTWEDECKKC